MTLQEAITCRHSVRRYTKQPIAETHIKALQQQIDECNRLGGLHIQLVTNETKAFTGILAYGKFANVANYIVMVGEKSTDLDERVGFYGEKLVLFAQTLGLNTCWVGLSYRKTDAYEVSSNEKLACMIAIGYGETQGVTHKIKTVNQVSNADADSPAWFVSGVKAALLAPTAINQQKFSFEYIPRQSGGKAKVRAHKGFSMVGYTQMDLGIAKLHFELAADKENFDWA